MYNVPNAASLQQAITARLGINTRAKEARVFVYNFFENSSHGDRDWRECSFVYLPEWYVVLHTREIRSHSLKINPSICHLAWPRRGHLALFSYIAPLFLPHVSRSLGVQSPYRPDTLERSELRHNGHSMTKPRHILRSNVRSDFFSLRASVCHCYLYTND